MNTYGCVAKREVSFMDGVLDSMSGVFLDYFPSFPFFSFFPTQDRGSHPWAFKDCISGRFGAKKCSTRRTG